MHLGRVEVIKEINGDCYQCEVNDLCPAFEIYTDEQKEERHPCCEVEVQDEEEQYIEVTEIVTGVFVNKKTGEIVITGIPENVLHNCDQMGCSSIDHVIYRCRLEQ